MHRLIVALIALTFTLSAAAYEFPPQDPNVQKYFAIACEYNECKDLRAPMVVFKDTGRALGYYYFGTDVVFITLDCATSPVADETKCAAVLIHEMTHYIQSKVHGVNENCASEEIAWDVYNAYVMDKGRLDLVRENWREAYPRCAKSQNTSTSSVTQ